VDVHFGRIALPGHREPEDVELSESPLGSAVWAAPDSLQAIAACWEYVAAQEDLANGPVHALISQLQHALSKKNI
jgi:hypothetical protein